jgi:hypothetical protein
VVDLNAKQAVKVDEEVSLIGGSAPRWAGLHDLIVYSKVPYRGGEWWPQYSKLYIASTDGRSRCLRSQEIGLGTVSTMSIFRLFFLSPRAALATVCKDGERVFTAEVVLRYSE